MVQLHGKILEAIGEVTREHGYEYVVHPRTAYVGAVSAQVRHQIRWTMSYKFETHEALLTFERLDLGYRLHYGSQYDEASVRRLLVCVRLLCRNTLTGWERRRQLRPSRPPAVVRAEQGQPSFFHAQVSS